MSASLPERRLRVGMAGLGMIFDDTYRPVFEQLRADGLYRRDLDHKKLRTHVVDGVLRHVNNGYCSLLEPKSISGKQFAEWIVGRNPGTYVAVHYIKLIDFTFGAPNARLARVAATGQRGLVGP